MADTRVGFSMVPKHPKEVQGIQVHVQPNQAKTVLCRFVHESQTPCRDTTVCRTTSEDSQNQGVWILQEHSNSNSCRDNSIAEDSSASEPACLWASNQNSVRSSQATHATNADILLSSAVYLALSLRDVQVLRGVLFSTTECVHGARG